MTNKFILFTSELSRNINVSIMTPLISYISITILRENNSYLGLCNSVLSFGFLIYSYYCGKFTDKFNKKNLMLLSLMLFCLSLGLTYICYMITYELKYIWLLSLFVISFSFTLYELVLSGYVANVYDHNKIVNINAILNVASSLGTMIGPIVFTYLLFALSFEVTIIGMILLAICSLVLIAKYFKNDNLKEVETTNKRKHTFVSSLKLIFSNQKITNVIIATVLINLSFAILYTLLPFHMMDNLKLTATEVLHIWSLVGVGQLIGSAICMLSKDKDNVKKTVFLSVISTIPIVVLLDYGINYWVVASIIISLNISRSIGAIARKSMQQTLIDKTMIGTIMGTISTITLGINTIGYLLGGILSEYIGISYAIGISIALLALSNLFMISLAKKAYE